MALEETFAPRPVRDDARESFRDFPDWCQPILTWVSGKPLACSQPRFMVSPLAAITIDLGKYAAGVGGAALAWMAGGVWWLTLPLCWILTVNATRSLTSDAHYAGHGSVTGKVWVDKAIGDMISFLAFAINMNDYAIPHNTGHHGRFGIGTTADPDIGLIRIVGWEMGRSMRYYRWRWVLSLISPRYHLIYFYQRLKSTFVTAPYWRMALAWTLWPGVVALAVAQGWGMVLVMALLVPLWPLYAVSAALQFPSEHKWLALQAASEPRKDYLLRVSHGRFFLLPAPQGVAGWLRWSLGMVPMAFQRCFVCPSILPVHDYHHRNAGCKTWPMEPWHRQAEIDKGAIYTDYWGLIAPTEAQFAVWAAADDAASPRPFTFLSLLFPPAKPSLTGDFVE